MISKLNSNQRKIVIGMMIEIRMIYYFSGYYLKVRFIKLLIEFDEF